MSSIGEKVIWITGASSGIGEALAYELCKNGNRLLLSSRREDALERVKSNCNIPENVVVLPLDLSHFDALPDITEKAISKFGKIDILINNGGISQRSLIAETKFQVFKKMIDVNYLGTIQLTNSLLPHFIKNKQGQFVTITSLMGKFGSPYRSGYCGAKHALHGFFDVLRMEHEKDGVDVTLICPGFIQTDVAKNALTADGSAQEKQDEATAKGLPVAACAKKIIRAIEKKKFEVYIGGKETFAVYLKRFFPKVLHNVVLKSVVR
ncbi:SDR family oxidoreductase [Maribacter antarcticus]|uniref:SDR family oxidoreductase n=1 Tax=Maribacter antarcticus TaxID=505250 RepID=UPI000479D001|nr:SDR family oxidoreductase [Maribacter antarcticus]